MLKELIAEIQSGLAFSRMKRRLRESWMERYQKKHQKKQSKSSKHNQANVIW